MSGKHRKRLRRCLSNQPAGQEDLELWAVVPWSYVVAFLPRLDDALTIRLVCQTVLEDLHQSLSPQDCALWLQRLLQERNLNLIPLTGPTSSNHPAFHDEHDEEEDKEAGRPFLEQQQQSTIPISKRWREATQHNRMLLAQTLKSMTPPTMSCLDTLMRVVKVLRYLPPEAAVGYSAKYGRQILPLRRNDDGPVDTSTIQNVINTDDLNDDNEDPNEDAEEDESSADKPPPPPPPLAVFPECRRGRQTQQGSGDNKSGKCPTCRFKIPRVAEGDLGRSQPGLPRRPRQIRRRNSNSDEEEDDEEERDPELSNPSLDDHFAIQAPSSSSRRALRMTTPASNEFMQLNFYYPKCFYNLPSDLVCPVCRVADRRTLVLAEFSYESRVGTERNRAHLMSLTWTPKEKETSEQDQADGVKDACDGRCAEDDVPSAEKAHANTISVESVSKDDVLRIPRKRPRLEMRTREETPPQKAPEAFPSFPPTRYREVCIPHALNAEEEDVVQYNHRHTVDCKQALTLHCSHCDRFGVVAPAVVCHEECCVPGTRITYGNRPSEPPFVVGACFQRQLCVQCRTYALPCWTCRKENGNDLCWSCVNDLKYRR